MRSFRKKSIYILASTVLCLCYYWMSLISPTSRFLTDLLKLFRLYNYELTDEQRRDRYHWYPMSVNVMKIVQDMNSGLAPVIQRLNSYNYSHIINCSHICQKYFKVLFLVKSATGNFVKRIHIRETWAKYGEEHRVVFLMGSDIENNSNILKESQNFNDILQFNFLDTYNNLTLKDMLGFKWVVENCMHVPYIAQVDDDANVTVTNVLNFFSNSENVKSRHFYGGKVKNNNRVIRHPNEKNSVTREEYPFRKYPPYTAGLCTFLTAETVKDMYFASFFTKHIRNDDCYLGMLARKLAIKPVQMRVFLFGKREKELNETDVLCEFGVTYV